jgi:hypothetical protein
MNFKLYCRAIVKKLHDIGKSTQSDQWNKIEDSEEIHTGTAI